MNDGKKLLTEKLYLYSYAITIKACHKWMYMDRQFGFVHDLYEVPHNFHSLPILNTLIKN